MISTHCDLGPWQELSADDYGRRKAELRASLISLARRVYPRLATSPLVYEIGTPRTYQRFTAAHEEPGAACGRRSTIRTKERFPTSCACLDSG